MDFSIESLEGSKDATFDSIFGQRDNGDPVGFRIVGTSSDAYQKADNLIQAMNVADAVKRRVPSDPETPEGAQMLSEASDRRRDVILQHCVVGWFGFTLGENGPAEFTPENLQRVLKARPQWKKQLVAAIENEGNFYKG